MPAMDPGPGAAQTAPMADDAHPGLRPRGHRGPLLILAAATLLLYAPVLFGDRALLGVHTDQLVPWSADPLLGDPDTLLQASEPLASDKTLMFHPQLVVAIDRLGQGELPLWNPHNLCGVPLLAQAVHGLLHPPNLLAWWLPLPQAYGWITALQTFLAATFAYLLARQLGTGARAGLLAASSFALCGFLGTRQHWYQIQGASIGLPLVLYAVERCWARGLAAGARQRLRSDGTEQIPVIAVGLGCSFLAGFPQSSLLIAYAAALWCSVRFVQATDGLRNWRARAAWLASGRVSLGLALGVALGLPQLGPAIALAESGESTRAAVEPEVVQSLGMNTASLARVVLPNVYGTPHQLARHELPQLRARGALSRVLQKPHANHVETAGTIGLAALLAACLGLRTRRRGRGLGLTLMLAGLILALDTPLLLAVVRLPGLDTADPRRFLLLFAMGGSILAALGAQSILERGVRVRTVRAFRVLTYVVVAATAAAFLLLDRDAFVDLIADPLAQATGVSSGEIRSHAADLAIDLSILRTSLARCAVILLLCSLTLRIAAGRAPRVAAGLLALISMTELGQLASQSITALPAEGFFAAPPQAALLAGDGSGRLSRFHPGDPSPLTYPLPPNTGLPFGIRDVSGYITLAPRRIEALHELLQPGTTFGVGTAALSDPQALDSPLLDVMAVDRVLSSTALTREGLTPLGQVGNALLYRNESARPRAYLAPSTSVRRVPPAPELGPYLPGRAAPRSSWYGDGDTQGGFPLGPFARSPVAFPIVEHDGPPDPLDAQQPAPANWGRATITLDEPERVELQIDAPADGWLFLVDTFMPGWSAALDGNPVPIHPGNLAFRAIPVPAGEHDVVFAYTAPGWRAGLLAGLAAALILALITLVVPRRRPAATSVPDEQGQPAEPPA